MLNSLAFVAKRLCGLFNKKFKAAEHDRNGQEKTAKINPDGSVDVNIKLSDLAKKYAKESLDLPQGVSERFHVTYCLD